MSEQLDARLELVTKTGIAPDNGFYVTSIYPTEVYVNGQWLLAKNQRMDATIVVIKTATGFVAECKILRDLQIGELVVIGLSGVRELQKHATQEHDEFSFMSAGVSSERRVELVVKQVAQELSQIRDRGGKVIVTAGPVIIHTGAGEYLAWLIQRGYVQVLLGGNAIAVHDIEQNLLGTSLGVDLESGVGVRGGHGHHLQAINEIHRCGSIARAVELGILKSGVMYECVMKGIPYSLAGSIRDDGPLPDTEMDLIRAQTEYARLLQGADMVLMLSSMLHSIGVGNMTPARVKMICVDINPSVVTKLSDRGSLESIGVVTDVGLFLSLLVRYLDKGESQYKAA
jgi:lysine-ketoglutarate reductase/saccharopine dehydrogenase-like protein (TIGR00300 family)